MTLGRIRAPGLLWAGCDGSGGRFSRNARLRRCGYAFVIFSSEGRVLLSLQAPLPGPKQTVPRAEISALIEVFNHTEGDILICSDCKHVVDIFNKGASYLTTILENKDLWTELKLALDNRSGSVSVEWCPSHEEEAAVQSGLISPCHFVANYVADNTIQSTLQVFEQSTIS